MNQNSNMAGLASLLAARGRNGDSVLVHMTPEEVGGLQALAVANGGSLSVNPDTGLPEANFLKAILPAIAGSTLKTLFPKLGSATTGLIVGAATGLIDKSFDKGLRSGLSAYSGAKTMEGLAAARKAVQPGSVTPRITTERGEELSAKRLMDKAPIDVSKLVVEAPQVQTVTKAPSLFGEMGQGIRALFKPEGQEAFLEAVEGPYKRQGLKDLSRSAYFAGLANLAATEPKKIKPGTGSSGARFYIPGDVNPLYGQGYDQWYFKPGYFSDKYPGYADGGEVMVSPGAVLEQRVTGTTPQFTQDRKGLKDYYESLLVPPDTTPRDTSDLQRYLDELNARLRRPYQPVSGYEYGALPAPGTGGGGGGAGGTVTPPGVDPFATGVTGTPIEFLAPPTKPEPPAPREELTPPSTIAQPATPSDLGNLFTVPTTINMPKGAIEVLPLEQEVIPDVTEDEMVAADALGDLFSKPMPIAAIGAGGLKPIVSEPEEDTSSVEVQTVDDSGKPMTIPVSVGGMGADIVGASGLPPLTKTGVISTTPLTPEQAAALEQMMLNDAAQQKGFTDLGDISDLGITDLQDIADESKPIVDEILQKFDEDQAAEDLRQKIYEDMGGVGAVPAVGFDLPIDQFTPSMSTPDIGDLSKPVVDQILKDFDAQMAAEGQDKGIFSKFFDLLEKTGGVTGAVVSTLREAGEQYKKGDLDAKKLIEAAAKGAFGEELVEEAQKILSGKKEEGEKEAETPTEQPAEEKPTTAKVPAGGGSAIPFVPIRNYTIRDLINPTEVGGGGTPTITVEEVSTPTVTVDEMAEGRRAGGRIRAFSAGGLGSLQQYAVGGKLVNGQGDGMSDDIKANISGVQEARLADGEFVIPADVVSHLGNGSTDAGAKQLYAMMDRIRKARTGRTRQAPEVEASKYMPA